jgi:hypothetical protein
MENKKKVINVNHVLFVCGLIGCLVVLVSMGMHWNEHGTPFFVGIGLFESPVVDTLFTLVWPIVLLVWGGSELRKKKQT